MIESFRLGVHRMGYTRLRRLILAAGLVILIIVGAVMYARRVEPVEVIATLLFIPIFVSFFFFDVWGGLAAAVLAAALYAWLRYPAIDAVGFDRFAGMIGSRAVAYVLFGLIGGWASKQLRGSLDKLELYDQIDDATGLYNARFFLDDTELEMSRAQRYQTIFSVAMVQFAESVLDGMPSRQRRMVLRDVGRLLGTSVRTVDRAIHATDGRTHYLSVILPETASQGATVFTERLAEQLVGYLRSKGATVDPAAFRHQVATFPGEEELLQELRSMFAQIDQMERPAADVTPGRPS